MMKTNQNQAHSWTNDYNFRKQMHGNGKQENAYNTNEKTNKTDIPIVNQITCLNKKYESDLL